MAKRVLLSRLIACNRRQVLSKGRVFLHTSSCSDFNVNDLSSGTLYSKSALYYQKPCNGNRKFTSKTTVLRKEEENEEDDCPPWQNPLHHNNPEVDKSIMLEDYDENNPPEIVPLPPMDDGSGKVLAPPHLHELADEIVSLNMMEVKELVDRVSDHFDFEDIDEASMAMGGEGDGQEAAAEEVVEEKTVFDLKLNAFDAKSKIKVIKEIRSITSLGLKDAKEMVEGAPKVIKKDIKKEEAEELMAKLEAVGATCEIV